MEDLYEILEVPRNATQADIKKSYRKLVHQYHPDSHPGDKDIEEKFKKINAAYSVLSDPEKRSRYDTYGTTNPNENPFGGMGGVDLGDLFGDIFSGFGGFGFTGASSGSRRDPNAPTRGDDLEMVFEITLLEASQDTKKNIDVMRWDTCEVCHGSGAKAGTHAETCSRCKGTGQIRQTQQTFLGSMITMTTCPDCRGTGKFIREKCTNCDGVGKIHRKHNIEVKIPAGVSRGTRIRVAGAGEAGTNGGSPGDLYLIADVKPNERFERDGADLHTHLILTYPQAVLGTEAEIENLDSSREKIPVPPGTAHGNVLKVKGRGMPRLNNPRVKGDLYVHVYIDVPTKLTDKQRKLITELASEMKAPVGVNEPGFFDKFRNLFK